LSITVIIIKWPTPMSSKPVRITLLGSNSGNNLGDAAILSATLDLFSRALPSVEFLVPSTNPDFINKNYGKQYNVRGINVMPWTGSIRLLGIPTFSAIARSDAALIGDGIIFGKKILNPLFNFLITLIFIAPWCKLTGCKLMCYCCGIGPFHNALSRWCAKSVMNLCDTVTLRDPDGIELARQIGVTVPIELTSDVAFLNPISSEQRAREICRKEGISLEKPLLGINMTKYLDSWLAPGEGLSDKSAFVKEMGRSIKRACNSVKDKFSVVVFSTHPMDEAIVRELARDIDAGVIENSRYLSHDIQAVMSLCDLFIGMRFHSLVLASSAGAPVIGLAYAPKVRGLMRSIDKELLVELADFSEKNFASLLVKAWGERKSLKEKQQQTIDTFRQAVTDTTTKIAARLDDKYRSIESLDVRNETTKIAVGG
jgi:polysaccharide pyruvyl transferase WcaK-like protein